MLFGKKKINIVGLDIGSRTLKVAEVVQSNTGYTLKKFGMNDITPGLIEDGAIKNPEEVANAIRKLFKMYKVKEKNVAVSIGGYSIIVKPITVQTMPEDQLQETIHFEAEQYIPFDISDVNLDFQIMGEDEADPGQMNVLLVAAKKEVVDDYVRLINMAGLTPKIIDVDAFALQNIYEANYETDDNVALIDIGANKTTLNILRGDYSVLIRDVTLGCSQISQQITSQIGGSMEEAEQLYHSGESDQIAQKDLIEIVSSIVTDWCSEVRRALDFFYTTYHGEHIKKIILSGGGANIAQFRQLLAEETSSDVQMINPFENFLLGGTFDPAYLERVSPQAAICMGLALRRLNDK
ncbi:type IV pilus assembly protein PilM [Desulfobacterales bacterium HSG16]|nr:type IV pilus assembly protein PilM [Desulfobacterales bacterium HSG16]